MQISYSGYYGALPRLGREFDSRYLLNSFRKPIVFALFKSQGPIAAAKDTKEEGPFDSEVSTKKCYNIICENI